MADAAFGIDTMSTSFVKPVPITPVPVNFVATHEELVRSARDMWAVAVSLLTELTPAKFTTAPWAAALFTIELPFIMAKLWHLQQGLITTAHSYLESEAMLITILETIDVPKLFQELTTWAIELGPLKDLPFGISQHVPPVQMLAPESVDIVKNRFTETTWSGLPLIRHEEYPSVSGNNSHWFYLPKSEGWGVFDSGARPAQLTELQETLQIKPDTEVHYVGLKDGVLAMPSQEVLDQLRGVEGTVSVYKVGAV
ncbi:MAG: hypothetical protein RJA78_785 [Actinomycetota bacterium]